MEDNLEAHIKLDLKESIIKEALSSGVDLRVFSLEVERELKDVETVSVQDYIKQGTDLALLHTQFVDCDVALERMEKLLNTFRSQLGGLSSDILALQHQSSQLGLRLINRQAVQQCSGQIIDDLIIPENLIRDLLEIPVTEPAFSDQLLVLQTKLALSGEHQHCSKAAQDVVGVLTALRIKTLERIRLFLLQKLQQLKRPLANYQLPQNSLLKHKNFYHFLITQEPEIAYEIRQEYLQTMSKLYFSYFKSYATRLLKLVDSNNVNKDDLLGAEDSSLGAAAAAAARSLFGRAAPVGRSSSNKSTVFTLGTRIESVTNLEAPVLVPHAAATGTSAGHKGETKYSYEVLFRSQHFALADNACREFLFLSEFFHVESQPAQDELFQEVMGKTCTIYLKYVEEYISTCYDSLALFLCIQMVQRLQYMCHKRAVPALDFYFESLANILWPRFEYLVQANIQSVRDCDPSRLYSNIDTRPHYIVRRYAEYTSAISGIHEYNSITSAMDWTPRLHHMLATLQEEVEGLTLRLASTFTKRKDQLVSLINNFDLMMSVMAEHTREESCEAVRCKELLNSRIAEFVEEILLFYFEPLVRFVKDCEMATSRGLTEALRGEERRATQTISSFMAGWKKSLDEINKEILHLFPNFKNGTNILQLTLTQLVEYYHRFQKILSQHPFRNVPARADLINIHQLMVEVRRYKPAF